MPLNFAIHTIYHPSSLTSINTSEKMGFDVFTYKASCSSIAQEEICWELILIEILPQIPRIWRSKKKFGIFYFTIKVFASSLCHWISLKACSFGSCTLVLYLQLPGALMESYGTYDGVQSSDEFLAYHVFALTSWGRSPFRSTLV